MFTKLKTNSLKNTCLWLEKMYPAAVHQQAATLVLVEKIVTVLVGSHQICFSRQALTPAGLCDSQTRAKLTADAKAALVN